MGPTYEHFKFAIGQFVQQKLNADCPDRKMIVIERLYQECPGGVQLHYRCRPQREMVQQYLEIEIEDYIQDADQVSDGFAAMMLDRANRRRAAAANTAAEVEPDAGSTSQT